MGTHRQSDSVAYISCPEAMAMSLSALSDLISVRGSRMYLNTRTLMGPNRRSGCCLLGDMSVIAVDAAVKYENDGHVWKTQEQINLQMIHGCPKL